MPRRRPHGFSERVTTAIESMIPGTLGGRVSSASPAITFEGRATGRGDASVVAGSPVVPSPVAQAIEVGSNGQTVFTLDYLPIEDNDFSSVQVQIRGQRLTPGTDYTVDYAEGTVTLTGTVTAYATPAPADEVVIDYWTTGALPADVEASVILDTWSGHNPTTNWNPFTFGDTLEPTDLCLVATVGTGSTTPSGRGTWSKIVSTTTPNRTLDVWLGYNFDNAATSITLAAGVLGGATAYRISTPNAQTSLPANSSAAGSSVFNPASVATGSVTPAAGDVVLAFLGGDNSPGDISTRTDTGTTLDSEIVNEVSGTSLATAAAIAPAAVSSSASWAISGTSDWWKAVIVKVTPS